MHSSSAVGHKFNRLISTVVIDISVHVTLVNINNAIGTSHVDLSHLYDQHEQMQSSAGGRPISTAMSRQMIGTRGNLTSSMGTTAAQGVALGTTVNVSDRPVTQQGMRGMKTAQGPTRQVQDSSYYVGILRGKVVFYVKMVCLIYIFF